MAALLDNLVDVDFLDALGTLAPGFGFGVILGIIFAAIGWAYGTVFIAAGFRE